MGLTEANIEQVTARIIALRQRFDEIAEIQSLLHRTELWRSKDGTLAVGTISEEEKAALEARINLLLNEAEAIIATVRGMAGTKPDHAV